tara:strand:+ start:3035 stop:4000 length:966 start_codon:yes stop_codon:yes gene_type:complete
MTKIIAELCQNHKGDLSILKEMVHAASETGAEYCKIQSIKSAELTHRPKFDNGIIDKGKTVVIKRPYDAELKRLKPLDLSEDAHFKFIEFCKEYKIKPTTTIFTRSRLKFIEKMNLDLIKIASFDCASHKMIEEVSNSNIKNIVVSTGTAYDSEIEKTSQILKKSGKNFSLLHCVSIYPTPVQFANLNRINFLKTLSNSVGFSDHSKTEEDGIKLSVASLLYNVDFIERHFTIIGKSETKDGVVSLNPNELKKLVEMTKKNKNEILEYIKENFTNHADSLGKEKRPLSHEELLNRDYYRGRFASINSNGDYIYNWEEKEIN